MALSSFMIKIEIKACQLSTGFSKTSRTSKNCHLLHQNERKAIFRQILFQKLLELQLKKLHSRFLKSVEN
jgi:hypothetical protein